MGIVSNKKISNNEESIGTIIIRWIVGLTLILLGSILGVSWLIFCFGSVIVGILLLIFCPDCLLFPFGLVALGVCAIKDC